MSGNEKKVPIRRFKEFEDAGDWEACKLVDTVDISTNMVDPKGGSFDNLPHIGPGNIESFTGCLLSNVNTVKEDNLISGKFHFNKGDVIYGKINPQLGKYVYAPYEGLASADAYVLNAKNGLDQTFLFTLLQIRHFFKYSVSVSMRSGMPKINRDELNVYSFMSPCDKEQEQIGKFFLNLDNIITLHQRKLEKMKALKKAYLTEMFPTEGEHKPKVRFAGFTDDWDQRKLGEIVEFLDEQRKPLESGTRESGEYPYYGASGIIDYVKDYLFDEELILLSEDGANIVDRNYRVCFLASGKYWVNNHAHVLKSKDNYCNGFICEALERLDYSQYNTGTAQPKLNQEVCRNIIIMVPNIEEQLRISSYLVNLDNLITLHQHKLEKLQNIKKAYLNEMFI